MLEFLTALHWYMGHRRFSTFAICRLFNPKDRSEQRKLLRETWDALGVGEPTLNSVEQVLKSGHCTIVRTATGPYTVRRVPLAYNAQRTAWMFDSPGAGRESFLRVLRARFAGKELQFDSAYALLQGDRELEDLSTTAGKRKLNPLSRAEFLALLKYCVMVRVDGFVLTRRASRFWLFVRIE